MVSQETWLLWRPDDSEASVPGIGADSVRHGGSGTSCGRSVAGTGVSYGQPSSEVETDKLTYVSLCLIHGEEI